MPLDEISPQGRKSACQRFATQGITNHQDSNGLFGNLQMAGEMGAPATAVRAHEEVFAYWASMREGARLPSRAQLNPDYIKRHLPTVSLIDVYTDQITGRRAS